MTGSTSFALQGMDVQAHDIDIQTDEASAYKLGTLLKEHCVEPVRFCGTDKDTLPLWQVPGGRG